GAAGRHVPHLFVVVPGADDGLGEDRRVGGDPGDGVLFDAPGQLTAVQHPAGYLIGPGGDAGQTEAVEVGKAHTSTLPGCGARPGAKPATDVPDFGQDGWREWGSHPPRRPGCVLRLGRAAPRPVAARD